MHGDKRGQQRLPQPMQGSGHHQRGCAASNNFTFATGSRWQSAPDGPQAGSKWLLLCWLGLPRVSFLSVLIS